MIDETKGAADVQQQIARGMAAFKAGAVARADERRRLAMEAGTYLAMPSAPTVAPERMTRAQVDADWQRRGTQPWPSGNADRFAGRAVFGIGWRS